MKKRITAIAAAALLALSSAPGAVYADGDIEWVDDYDPGYYEENPEEPEDP